MSRSRWAATFSALLLAILVLAGLTVPVPFVSISRGPTYDTLGQSGQEPVVSVRTLPTYPTSGHLNMTTVSVSDGLTATDALVRWLSADYQVRTRDLVYPPGQTVEQITERNEVAFSDSQASAEGAAFLYLGLPTVLVVDGIPVNGESAARGVLQPSDTILAVAGTPVTTPQQLVAVLAATRPGQRIAVTIRRGDENPRELDLVLDARSDGQQGAMGIVPGARPADQNEVTISLGEVGGPSAGLMFTLAIVDKLTPGELTSGRFIAGTGTITSTGLVGKIEGIRFKMLAAREAGATAFLVPADNCEEALANVPDGLTLARVDTLQDAVTAVDTLGKGGAPRPC